MKNNNGKLALFAPILIGIFLTICAIFGQAATAMAQGKGTVTFDFSINDFVKDKQTSLWIPYPMPDADQNITNVSITGNFDHQEMYQDATSGTTYLYAEWKNTKETPKLQFSFLVDSHFKKGEPLKDGGNNIPSDIQKYLAATPFIPCNDPTIKEAANQAIAGKTTLLEKARAVYEWTIKNTYRDPEVKGCGLGSPIETLTKANGGGKCADISSVFVAVARAAGIPAREVYSLRTSGKNGDITGDYHCWAEFYLPGTGWVKADPADVRKAMLVQKLELSDKATAERTEFFWNGDDLFRIVLGRSDRGITFEPKQKNAPLDYFMYPYAEVNGKALDYFSPKTFSYKVTFEADSNQSALPPSCCE